MARGAPALLLLFILLFLLAAAPSFAKDSWNIDCGGSSSFKGANGRMFEGDGSYIGTGVSRQIRGTASDNTPAELSTLREFPLASWKKSCYTIPVEQGTKVLVRTKYYYGNYDGRNSPPAFHVYYDTSVWHSVVTTSESWTYGEVVYMTTKKQGTDICLIRTAKTLDGQSPFVSTIEVQKLDTNMYSLLDFSTKSLFYRSRYAFGIKETISDSYNRNWNRYDGVLMAVQRTSGTPVVVNETDDSPPSRLFEAAGIARIVDNNTASNLTIPMPLNSSNPISIYFTMYFTEPLVSNGKRMLNVYIGDVLFTEKPIQLRYGLATEFSSLVDNASNETAFNLAPAVGSTLPPAISGIEVFSLTDILNATDSREVEILSMLQGNFTLFQNWTGDPCQPEGFNWEWVGCKYPDKSPPRINKLILTGYHLSGNIPDFRALNALEVINNSFTGKAPDFLAFLPNLQTLDLSFNDFDSLPPMLLNNPNITLITRGNPKIEALVQSPPASPTLISACVNVRISKFTLLVLFLTATAML